MAKKTREVVKAIDNEALHAYMKTPEAKRLMRQEGLRRSYSPFRRLTEMSTHAPIMLYQGLKPKPLATLKVEAGRLEVIQNTSHPKHYLDNARRFAVRLPARFSNRVKYKEIAW